MTELRGGSPATHDVGAQPVPCKSFHHPVVGPVTVICDVLDITDRDQRVVIYAAADSPSEEALPAVADRRPTAGRAWMRPTVWTS